MSEEDTSVGKTFTQADVDKAFAAGAYREREKYSDYDDLRARAAAADADQGKMDQILASLKAAEDRATAAEAATMRRAVADELGLTAKQAARLTGATREELLTDGRDLMETMGIKPRGSTAEAGDGNDGSGAGQEQQTETTPRRQRPVETLASGAPRTPTQPDEMDPAKLAALIPRR